MSKSKPLVIILITLVAIILCGAPTVSLLGAVGLVLDAFPNGTSGSGSLVLWVAACALGGGLLLLGFYLSSYKWKLEAKALSTLVLVQLSMVISIGVAGTMLLLFGGALVFLTVLLP